MYRIASLGEFAAYHVLRIVFEEMATADFGVFAAGLRAVAVESGFNTNICRAGVHALLVDSDVAREHADEIVQLLILLSRCENEQVHEEAAQYVVELRREGVDMISPAVNGCADALLASINLGGMLRMIFPSERIRIRRLVMLFINILLYGLGSDKEEESIRRTIVTRGLEVARDGVTPSRSQAWTTADQSIRVALVRGHLQEKGSPSLNYWEMGFQLASDREAIIRTGDLFFLEHGNVFDLSYDDFRAVVHSENGLLSWMALSVLPLHYEHASDKASAAGYLMQLIREGTEMDRYVVGESAVILLRNGGEDAVEAERLLDAIGAEYDRDPSQIFLHPEPLPLAGDLGAVAATRRASETMREESDPYALPVDRPPRRRAPPLLREYRRLSHHHAADAP